MLSRRAGWIDAGAFVLAAALLGWQLFATPVAGLANNGDFGKVIGLFGFGAPSEDEYKFAPPKYSFEPRYRFRSGFYSSEALLVPAALGLNALFSKPGSFDIRSMGAVHGALFLAAFYLLLPRRALLLAAMIFIFCDTMYATAFNSFYMDTGAVLFLLLAIALYLRCLERPSAISRCALVIACVLLVTSKTQHLLLGLPIAALLFWTGRRRFGAPAAVLVLAATAFSATAAPADYAADGYYSVIFTRILPNSKDVPGDLRDLGLDDSYRRYIGTHAYSDTAGMNNPEFVRVFRQRTSYARLAWFYLKHPGRTWEILRAAMGDAGRQRPLLGNFDRSTGFPEFTESRRFTRWSSLKQSIFYERGAVYVVYFVCLAALVCGLAIARRRTLPRGLPQAACVVGVMALLEMLVAALGDAVDTGRHFFLFNCLLDVLAVVALALVLFAPFAPLRET